VQHLIEQGHKRIGLWVSQAPAIWVHQRHEGYKQALRERGLTPDERLVLWTPYVPVADATLKTQLAHIDALRMYLKEQRPTGLVIASSGQHTRTLGEVIRKDKMRIPEELSVVFLDQNYEDYSHYLHRRPTVVALPLVEMGRKLARLAGVIHRAKTQEGMKAEPLTVLPCTLVNGDSVERRK
jgi:LacI family transcriptional regulator